MPEENQIVDVKALPKFDMPSYESKMTAKDVKSLALRYGIPLDLEPIALTEGWTMDKLPDDMIDRRAIPDTMAWRHHDSDINDSALEDGFSMQDVQALTERVIDIRHVPFGLLFQGGLATTWDILVFVLFSKIPRGMRVKTSPRRQITKEGSKWKILKSLPPGREKRRPKTAGQKDGPVASKATSSPEPIRTLNPHQPSGALAATAESREDRSPHASPRDLANRSVHNYSDDHHDEETYDLNIGSSYEQSGRVLTFVNTEVIQPSLECQSVNQGPIIDRVVTPLRTTTQGAKAEMDESSREGALYEESNALNNATALERAWFSLARGSLAQTNILERFENLQTDFDRLAESHTKCRDLAEKLVQARLDLTHSSHLYTSLSDQHKALNNEHESCARKLEELENCNRELSQANRDQVLRIKELEDALAQKDFAFVCAERINVKHAQHKEKLVSQVGRAEMEKFDCICKILPTLVERLLQSHEYKRSLSEPFNLAIQASWGKGLAEEDLLELMGRMEGFDVHADTKMRVEYDKLFERRYPYAEKISRGFCHSVSDLVKVYPDSPPHEQVPPHKHSSEKAPSTSAPPGSILLFLLWFVYV
nr:hypothetical protein [Tanacetum cinerariifolium]